MKILGNILALLALCMAGSASAQITQACVPYKMPIESTITSCGPGLVGSKFKTTTKVCPSGTVTESSDYDTSGCAVAPVPGGTVNNTTKCALMPDSCAVLPVAQNCPSGSHWSLLGSGIAHCVKDDPTCPWGTSLKHDAMGNPSCEQNTCPSGQVLQGDGISCGCSGGQVWNGTSCVPPAPTCVASDALDGWVLTCPDTPGYRYRHTTVSCPAGPYGAPVTASYWDVSECEATPPSTPSCTAGTTQEYGSCPAGYYGATVRNVYTSCPLGSYGAPSVSYSGWNNLCTPSTPSNPPPSGDPSTPSDPTPPACTQTSSTTSTACGSGYTGTKYITTTQLCPSGSSTSEDTSGCGCANGGSNYPTCTPPFTPPPPPPAPTVTCGPWSHEDTSKMMICDYIQEHPTSRTCSDGSVEYNVYFDSFAYYCLSS